LNSIWNNNLEVFKNRFPSLAEMYADAISFVSAHSENPQQFLDFWQISSAKNGELTATEQGLRIHSSYNPGREASGAVQTDAVKSKSNIIFLGFGLGYNVIEAAKNFPQKKIILIEPEPMHFFGAMLLIDWTTVFKVENLVLAIGCPVENVLQLIEDNHKINIGKTGISDSFIFDIPALTNHSSDYFNNIKEIFQRNIEKNKINEATLKKFGKLWIRNSLINIDELQNRSGIYLFENKAQISSDVNLPFLILGAGPSLEKILPFIDDLKKRCVIVCVETALHTLLRHNIQPDFIILMDPQFWAYKHISGLEAPESILITELSAYPSVFRFKCKNILLSSSQFPVGQYFEKQLNYFPGDLGTGGSVASSAWNFARYCGAKKIYLAGLDLGFPGKESHIKGSSAEQTFHKCADRLSTAEKSGINSLFSANAQVSTNYLDKPIITDSRMKMFAWWFESRLAACPETENFTFCPEGLKIPGIQIADLQDFLKNSKDISVEKKAFLQLSEKNISDFNNMLDKDLFEKTKKIFPDEKFWEDYSFLKDYWPEINS